MLLIQKNEFLYKRHLSNKKKLLNIMMKKNDDKWHHFLCLCVITLFLINDSSFLYLENNSRFFSMLLIFRTYTYILQCNLMHEIAVCS